MIISASRRTDIPAFYSEWFINRIRAGYCTVPNPYNPKQISRISLTPADVDVIVFWTRNPRPLMRYMDELDAQGYRYYFQFTLMDNPIQLDRAKPNFPAAIATFQQLSERIGPDRMIWRYDPIVISNQTGVEFHMKTYQHIAEMLSGYTHRSVISILDDYKKTRTRLNALAEEGLHIVHHNGQDSPNLDLLMTNLKRTADAHKMRLTSCAEEIDLAGYGITPGKCIDDTLIKQLFDIDVSAQKDKSQRKACGCVTSRDIGMYDTCLFECQYCYASSSFSRARTNFQEHDPTSPSLIGWYDVKQSD